VSTGKPNAERARRDPLSKALHIINWMIEQEPESASWGIRELAAEVGMPPSTVYRVLSSLEIHGLVESDDDRRYRLGMEFFRLGWRATARLPVHRAAVGPMRELVGESNETALLGLLEPARLEMMYVVQVESRQPLRYVVALHEWLPLHAGAGGLGLLAFLDEEIWDKIIEGGLPAFTDHTITDPMQLVKELRAIRARGYVVSHGGRISGAVGVGAPVFGALGEVVADVVLTVPETRWNAKAEERFAGLVTACAESVTTHLGGRRLQAV
jgi:IclR family transcriptional regulator, acetate operon repressor